jgi:hypothetical protein
LIPAWLEIDLGVDRSRHEVAAVAAYHIIFFAFFLHAELEDEAVFTGEAFEVTGVELCFLVWWYFQRGLIE